MMAHAGLAEPSLLVLRAAVADGGTVARFRSKIAVVPGSGCEYWTSAISGRGHGRFWVGAVAARDGVVIAHRFAWAHEHGVDALEQVPVLGHRSDNPLGQRIGDGHVMASSHWLNRRECALRRHTIGGTLRDTRGARGRTGGAARRGSSPTHSPQSGRRGDSWRGFRLRALPLWDEPLSFCEIAQMKDAG